MSNRRYRGVKMINLWFLWFLQKCHRNCWELKWVHAYSGKPRLESLALGCLDFDRTVLTLTWVDIEAKSEPVGVQVRRLYDRAGHPTTHSSWCSSALAADARRDRAPAILFAGEAAGGCRWSRGNRSSDSQPNVITLHLGLPHSWGALFLFKSNR